MEDNKDLKEDVKNIEEKDINTDNSDKEGDVDDIKEKLRKELAEELEKEKQKEIDKRVTEALKKREKKMKEEQEEKDRLAKLTEEERIDELKRKAEQELKEREKKVVLLELKQSLVDVLNENQLDLGFRDVIDVESMVNIDDETKRVEVLKANVVKVKGIVDKLVNNKIEEFKREYLKGDTPKKLGGDGTVTPQSDYEKAQKSGDVRSMLQYKLFNKKD